MPAILNQIADHLVGRDTLARLRSIGHVKGTVFTGEEATELLTLFAAKAGASPSIDVLDVFRLVLNQVRGSLSTVEFDTLSKLDNPYRNVIFSALSPNERRLSHDRKSPQSSLTEISVELPPDSDGSFDGDSNDAFRDMLVLSLGEAKLICDWAEAAKFRIRRCRDQSEARKQLQLNNQICGCIIDSTFLMPLSRTDQIDLISEVADYSSTMWLAVSSQGLQISEEELWRLISTRKCKLGRAGADELTMLDNDDIRSTELWKPKRASRILNAAQSLRMTSVDLEVAELLALTTAVIEWAESAGSDGVAMASSLETKLLSGGFSDAKLLRVRIASTGKFMIAKVGPSIQVREEMQRFDAHFRVWDRHLHPQGYFHAGCGVILQDVISTHQTGASPASMLEDDLDSLWNSEYFTSEQSKIAELEQRLSDGMVGFMDWLTGPAKQRPHPEFRSLGNPEMTHIRKSEAAGLGFFPSDQNIVEIRNRAELIFGRLADIGTVHADAHLRNLLVVGKNIFAIDYAGSGPGHPALDFVRIELAMFTTHFRNFVSLDIASSLQRAICGSDSSEKILANFPTIAKSAVNRLVVTACVKARDSALQVLEAHHGSRSDYLAAKILAGWQNIAMRGRSTELTKIVILEASESLRIQLQEIPTTERTQPILNGHLQDQTAQDDSN